MNGNLKKGLVAILTANILNLVFNLFTNFMLPKYLSVNSYAAIKTFQLYTTYIGIFALGYSDGMYLRYGGNELSSVDHKELKTGMFSFRLMMLIESMILIPLAFCMKDKVLLGFSFTIFTSNMTSYYKNLYQAVGEFKLYGKILNWITMATFVVNAFCLFVIKTDDYFVYLMGYALVDAAIWIILEINATRILNLNEKVRFSAKLLLSDIKAGILLMVGNFSNILLSSMDRWFVKSMMAAEQFAYYSFAVSMEGFLNVAITPITTTMYNYFCNHLKKEEVTQSRRLVMIFGTVIVSVAFPAKFIIEIWLNNYEGAIQVLFILFATQMIYIIIKGIYVNLYKATKNQNLYFQRLIMVLIVGAVLNGSFVKLYPFKEAFAYGTLVSAIIWLIISIRDFKEIEFEAREWIYLFIQIVAFIILGIECSSFVGLVVYCAVSIMCINIFMKKEMRIILSALYRTVFAHRHARH